MGQLMSKEVLYEPLKELAEGVSPPPPSSSLIYQHIHQFPPYLTNPPTPLSPEDRSRYKKQEECVRRILAVFDKPGYSDANEESNKVIVDLMSEVRYLPSSYLPFFLDSFIWVVTSLPFFFEWLSPFLVGLFLFE